MVRVETDPLKALAADVDIDIVRNFTSDVICHPCTGAPPLSHTFRYRHGHQWSTAYFPRAPELFISYVFCINCMCYINRRPV